MFIQVKDSKYFVTSLYKEPHGFSADIEHQDGKHFVLNFSSITQKFYKDGHNAKLPKYLCKEVLEMALSRGGLIVLSEVERENVLYNLYEL
jgi:hypothetical protein